MNNKYGYNYDSNRDTITKRVKRSKHFFRAYNGWAIDEGVLTEHPDSKYELIDTESGFTYQATGEVLREGSPVDYGHGRQRVLPVQEWTIIPTKQPKLI